MDIKKGGFAGNFAKEQLGKKTERFFYPVVIAIIINACAKICKQNYLDYLAVQHILSGEPGIRTNPGGSLPITGLLTAPQ